MSNQLANLAFSSFSCILALASKNAAIVATNHDILGSTVYNDVLRTTSDQRRILIINDNILLAVAGNKTCRDRILFYIEAFVHSETQDRLRKKTGKYIANLTARALSYYSSKTQSLDTEAVITERNSDGYNLYRVDITGFVNKTKIIVTDTRRLTHANSLFDIKWNDDLTAHELADLVKEALKNSSLRGNGTTNSYILYILSNGELNKEEYYFTNNSQSKSIEY